MTLWILVGIIIAVSIGLATTEAFVGNLTTSTGTGTDTGCECTGQLPKHIPWHYLNELCRLSIVLEDRLYAHLDVYDLVDHMQRLAQQLVDNDVQGVLVRQYELVDKLRALERMLERQAKPQEIIDYVKLMRKGIKLSCFKTL